jgi:hypothetical protein
MSMEDPPCTIYSGPRVPGDDEAVGEDRRITLDFGRAHRAARARTRGAVASNFGSDVDWWSCHQSDAGSLEVQYTLHLPR